MHKSNNAKLASNLGLMFIVYFMPKVFGFFLVPLYTAYLTTEEYGISDLIINTSSLISPFVAMGSTNAVMRFTIENKNDKRPYQIAIKIYTIGMTILLLGLWVIHHVLNIKLVYLCFIYLITGFSVLSDINMCYTKGVERLKIITICGVGSSLISILSNIFFIVILRIGLYGFLISSVVGYAFTVIVLVFYNRKDSLLKGILHVKASVLQKEMLQYGVPLIISGLSWWIVSSSDRYFVTWLCGAAVNGIYAVAYKIPTMLQTIHTVFSQAWIFTLYDSYKTEEGLKYIAKVYDFYSFIFCICCSALIMLAKPIAKILFSNDFFQAWKYVAPLLLSVVFTSMANFMGSFLSIYKKSIDVAVMAIINAVINIVLNYVFILVMDDAMGAAVATAITFFVSWCLNTYKGIRLSHIRLKLKKQIFIFAVLVVQSIVNIYVKNIIWSGCFLAVILVCNIENIQFFIVKSKKLIKKYIC